jgi:prepilin-type processing-associated H-X9-DG protein
MKTADKTSLRPGLTRFEVLALLFISGVLLAVLLPTIGNILETLHPACDSCNARIIAQAYLAHANKGGEPRMIQNPAQSNGTTANGVAANIEDVAFILAEFGQLNDATAWYNVRDQNLNDVRIPRFVVTGDANKATSVAQDFQKTSPKAWAFVTGLPMSAPASMTPLLWTYGLQHDGTWTKNSRWKGLGGHVAFLDGHVEWVDKLSNDPGGEYFTIHPANPNGGKATLDHSEAINSHDTHPAIVVNAMGR